MNTARTRRAFTLIEAIVAIVILSVALPPMLWAIRDSHTRRTDPVLATRARFLCAEKLEDVIADRHARSRGYAYITAGNYPAEPSISGFAGFSRGVQVVETAADLSTAGTGYKTVTVTTTYLDGRGQSRSLSLAAVLTDYSP